MYAGSLDYANQSALMNKVLQKKQELAQRVAEKTQLQTASRHVESSILALQHQVADLERPASMHSPFGHS